MLRLPHRLCDQQLVWNRSEFQYAVMMQERSTVQKTPSAVSAEVDDQQLYLRIGDHADRLMRGSLFGPQKLVWWKPAGLLGRSITEPRSGISYGPGADQH